MKFCGIDWANDHHDAFSIDEHGHQLGSIRVAHSPDGLSQLDSYLDRIAGPEGKEQLACIIETTQGLLIAYLLEQGWAVYPVNPRTVERRRAPSGAKTDIIDAYLLAKTGRADFVDLRRLNPDSEQIQELKTLTRDQDGLVQMQTRLVNQLTACLKAYYPLALELFSKLQQPSTLKFLRAYPTAASGPRSLGGRSGSSAQTSQISWSPAGCPTDGDPTPATLSASQRGHDTHQISADAGTDRPVGAVAQANC